MHINAAREIQILGERFNVKVDIKVSESDGYQVQWFGNEQYTESVKAQIKLQAYISTAFPSNYHHLVG